MVYLYLPLISMTMELSFCPIYSYLKLPIIVLELLIMNVGVSSYKSNNCILYRLKRFSNIFALGVILSSIFFQKIAIKSTSSFQSMLHNSKKSSLLTPKIGTKNIYAPINMLIGVTIIIASIFNGVISHSPYEPSDIGKNVLICSIFWFLKLFSFHSSF